MTSKGDGVAKGPKLILVKSVVPTENTIVSLDKPPKPIDLIPEAVWRENVVLDPQMITFQKQLQNYLQTVLHTPSFQRPLSTYVSHLQPASMAVACDELCVYNNNIIDEIEKYTTNINPELLNHDEAIEKGLHFLQLLYIMRCFLAMEYMYLKTL